LGLELRDFARRMEEVDEEKARDFAEEVREKARHMGKPVPPRDVGPLPRPLGASHGKGGRIQ